jgi:hypothetical protein
MSDTKWRKVFAALRDRPDLQGIQCVYKFVDHEEERFGGAVVWLHPPRPWVDTFAFGPIPLRSIEWLLFPHVLEERAHPTFPPRRTPQDVEGVRRLLSGLGRLPLEMTVRGLLVRGYLPA